MRKYLAVSLVMSALLGAPTHSETAVAMSPAELQTLLVGNTMPLGGTQVGKSKGAVYFADSRTAVLNWQGKTEDGTWTVGKNSQLCWSFRMFGGQECAALMGLRSTGGHVWIFEGQQRVLPPGAIVSGRAFK